MRVDRLAARRRALLNVCRVCVWRLRGCAEREERRPKVAPPPTALRDLQGQLKRPQREIEG